MLVECYPKQKEQKKKNSGQVNPLPKQTDKSDNALQSFPYMPFGMPIVFYISFFFFLIIIFIFFYFSFFSSAKIVFIRLDCMYLQ